MAWDRVRKAIDAGNARFTLYLARFIPAQQRTWLERWQDLNRRRYRNISQALTWPDDELPRIRCPALQEARHSFQLEC